MCCSNKTYKCPLKSKLSAGTRATEQWNIDDKNQGGVETSHQDSKDDKNNRKKLIQRIQQQEESAETMKD